MKQYAKTLNKDGECLKYITNLSNDKKQAGIFDSPQIRKLINWTKFFQLHDSCSRTLSSLINQGWISINQMCRDMTHQNGIPFIPLVRRSLYNNAQRVVMACVISHQKCSRFASERGRWRGGEWRQHDKLDQCAKASAVFWRVRVTVYFRVGLSLFNMDDLIEIVRQYKVIYGTKSKQYKISRLEQQFGRK